MTWAVERQEGSAATLHGRGLPEAPVRTAWVFVVDRPALVLGSTQPEGVVDRVEAERSGVQVVRRRSGGGAVLVVPDEMLWIDVVVPATDELAEPDVGRAAWWVGEAWAAALERCGETGATVHREPMVRRRWSSLVCFDGLGPGEVVLPDGKAVGLSQRRTREATRFQCAVHRRWDPARLVALLAPPAPRPDELGSVAEVAVALDDLAAAFLQSLPA